MLQRLIKILGVIGGITFISLIAIVAGGGVSIWVAFYTSKPIIFLSAGAVVFVLCYLIGSRIITKRIDQTKKRITLVILRIIGILILISLSTGLMRPILDKQATTSPLTDVLFWDLESGSRIAYRYIPSMGNKKPHPIIFLHGGPGVPDMNGDADYFGQLAKDGYDVYIYDQVGSGLSSRLEDPRQYTVERDVADLALIRKTIGSEKVILIGHSYGAQVAGNFLASHGDHVERVVFISPAALNPLDKSGGNLTNHLTRKEMWSLFPELFQPRILMAYTLLQVNPQAAHAFVGDDEMDARFDRVYAKTQPALHCRDYDLGPNLSGLGFYANQMPQSAGAAPPPDPRHKLNDVQTQALIIKGSCDYLSWSSALDYKDSLINSEIVYLSQAGHNIYQDQPSIVLQIIKAFIANESLPIPFYSGTKPPSDYGNN